LLVKLPRTRSPLSEKAATWAFGDPGVIGVEAVQEGFTARQKCPSKAINADPIVKASATTDW
jgi:hypothetical protein